MKQFRFPSDTQRIAVTGRTGSGKTVLGAWILSESAIDRKPYIMIDYKGDDLLGEIPYVNELALKDKIPKHPGLYIVRAIPDLDDDAMENFLWKIWAKENTGLYVDEAYMIPKGASYNAILTQGRQKKIPVISLSQRPVLCSKFVFTEADFYSVFALQWIGDRKKVGEYVPDYLHEDLPQYWSHYHDVQQNHTFRLRPVPSPDDILERFDARLVPKRKII